MNRKLNGAGEKHITGAHADDCTTFTYCLFMQTCVLERFLPCDCAVSPHSEYLPSFPLELSAKSGMVLIACRHTITIPVINEAANMEESALQQQEAADRSDKFSSDRSAMI